jgi:long-chain acyl-CoA synthetase
LPGLLEQARQDRRALDRDGWFASGDAVGTSTERGETSCYYDRVEHMARLAGGQTYPKQFIEIRLRFSPYIKEVMVVGDERHRFVSALVNIDGEVFARWAEQQGLSFTTFTDLSQRPEVVACVAAEIERVNRALPEGSRVQRFANLPKELDADEGELTRTRKLKREFIEQRYAALLDGLYGTQCAGRPGSRRCATRTAAAACCVRACCWPRRRPPSPPAAASPRLSPT